MMHTHAWLCVFSYWRHWTFLYTMLWMCSECQKWINQTFLNTFFAVLLSASFIASYCYTLSPVFLIMFCNSVLQFLSIIIFIILYRKCCLSETNKLCNYKIKLQEDDEWYSISQMCRNRVSHTFGAFVGVGKNRISWCSIHRCILAFLVVPGCNNKCIFIVIHGFSVTHVIACFYSWLIKSPFTKLLFAVL